MNKIKNFFKDVKAEMGNVNWPTRKQSVNFTLAVVFVSVLVAYYLGFFDWLLSKGLGKLLQK